jgi:type IV secretory pathway VirB4 component
MPNVKKTKPSQDFVPIKEVRDGIVTLKNGGLRAILMASSLNFALKGEDEQNAFIMQFQNFLNSLDFSVQISIQSRRLDIRPYIATLEERLKETVDELMRIQIREYIDFIKSFTEAANIMTKHFFVVVPYTPTTVNLSSSGPLSNLPWAKGKNAQKKDTFSFEENVSQLEQRVSIVQQGLVRSGVRTVQLGTEEVVELMYKIFNPGELDQPIQQGVSDKK